MWVATNVFNDYFKDYLTHWGLIPDGEPILTPTSRLLPVRHEGLPAMLKIAVEFEEKFGGGLMAWWNGNGAARVLAHDGDALLLEQAEGHESLAEMARNGRDDEACRIVCQVIARLHRPRSTPAPTVISLEEWFRELEPAATRYGGILALCASTAQSLLAAPQESVILHGDIHHGNILDFGARGWLAIDPKRLGGERGFDYANLFSNPDRDISTAPGTLARRAAIVAAAAGLDYKRLLQWVLAQSGLSAAWMLADGGSPEDRLEIAAQAAAELQNL